MVTATIIATATVTVTVIKTAMETDHVDFLGLYASGLGNGFYEPSEKANIPRIVSLASEQHVYPLIFNAIRGTKLFKSLPAEKVAVMKKKAFMTASNQIIKSKTFAELYQNMRNAGLSPVVFKGVILRSMYPAPELRPSGDEDIYAKKQELPKYDCVFRENGFVTRTELKKQLKPSVICTHYTHPESGLMVELHTTFAEFEDVAWYSRLTDELNDADKHAETYTADGCEYITFSPYDGFIHLFTHFVKHLVTSGAGIRHVSDIMLYMQHFSDTLDIPKAMNTFAKHGLETLFINTVAIGVTYLGFSAPNVLKSRLSEADPGALAEDLLSEGIFGNTDSMIYGGQVVASAIDADRGYCGKNAYIQTLFPRLSAMKVKYPILERAPFFLPFAWFFRIFKPFFLLIIGKRKRETFNMQKVSADAEKKIGLLKKYGVINAEKTGEGK